MRFARFVLPARGSSTRYRGEHEEVSNSGQMHEPASISKAIARERRGSASGATTYAELTVVQRLSSAFCLSLTQCRREPMPTIHSLIASPH